MIISEATKSHISELCNIENGVFGIDDFRLNRKNFSYHINKKHIFIACVKNKIAGYILFFVHKKSFRIYSIAVLDDFRRTGIAKELISYVCGMAKYEKKEYISLEVREDNLKAISLYSSLGFSTCKIIKSYYTDNTNALKMKFKLKLD
ncbi:MAG: N-acetyltransferase [Sulfurospirillaceae bacterium]|nr:N-acetyltransferase [Sulfurospirillaceae bacterium]